MRITGDRLCSMVPCNDSPLIFKDRYHHKGIIENVRFYAGSLVNWVVHHFFLPGRPLVFSAG